MKMRILNSAIILMLLFTASLIAQDYDLKKHPGYVDLDQIKIPKGAGDVTEVILGPELLRAFSAFAGSETEMDQFNNLFSIRVKSFEINQDMAEELYPVFSKIEKKLQKEGWSQLVRVKKNDEEHTNISIKYGKKGGMEGLVVMTIDPYGEAAFVNIIGAINLKDLGFLGNHIDGSALDSLGNL